MGIQRWKTCEFDSQGEVFQVVRRTVHDQGGRIFESVANGPIGYNRYRLLSRKQSGYCHCQGFCIGMIDIPLTRDCLSAMTASPLMLQDHRREVPDRDGQRQPGALSQHLASRLAPCDWLLSKQN